MLLFSFMMGNTCELGLCSLWQKLVAQLVISGSGILVCGEDQVEAITLTAFHYWPACDCLASHVCFTTPQTLALTGDQVFNIYTCRTTFRFKPR